MTRLVLEIPQQNDLPLLLAFLERLNIRIIQRSEENTVSTAQVEAAKAFILKGLPAREDFEEFVQEFEESRQDRPLPAREN